MCACATARARAPVSDSLPFFSPVPLTHRPYTHTPPPPRRSPIIVVFVAVPQPTYTGDDKILKLTPQRLKNLLRDHGTRNDGITNYLLVEFYAMYSPDCRHLAREYSELSVEHTTETFRFAKLDIGGKYADFAPEYGIKVGMLSQQLPTLVLFKNGRPCTQRPPVNQQGTQTGTTRFNTESILEEFDIIQRKSGADDGNKGKDKNDNDSTAATAAGGKKKND